MRTLPLFPGAFAVLLAAVLAGGCSGTSPMAGSSAQAEASTVAAYAGQRLTLPEFERRYARTVGGWRAAQEDSLSEYQDFLERYVNFRLKVIAARAAGYDDDPSIRQEIDGYRASFARPYLIDKAVLDPILEDLYEKNKEMVEASHILIRVAQDASPADTLAAYNKITALRDSASMGVSFGDLALRHSEDPSASARPGTQGYRGWLGYFSGGRMVKAFEDMAYQTPADSLSPVFRSPYGYHLLYVHDRRDAVPAIGVAHLLVRAQDGDTTRARARIDSLKQRLDAGEKFADLAREFSDDRASARNGGFLGVLRYDNYQVDPDFRTAAFSIEQVDSVSDVIETRYGFHLITITERNPLGTFEEEYEALKQTAARLPRLKEAEQALATELRAKYGVTIDTAAIAQGLAPARTDSFDAALFLRTLPNAQFPDSTRMRPVATLGDSTYTFGQVIDFAKENQVMRMLTLDEQAGKLADAYLDDAAISYEATALEERDPEFGLIMEEFRDGLVLFKLMEDSVWSAAARDSAGLEAYFAAHAARYRFPDRTRIIELYSWSDSLLTAAVERLDGGLAPEALVAELDQDTTRDVRVDTVLTASVTDSIYDRALGLAEGAHTDVMPYRTGYVVLLADGTEPARAKTLDEARTEVVNDYQQVIEERLVERLRRRYGAQTFPDRLARAFTGPPPTAATATMQ